MHVQQQQDNSVVIKFVNQTQSVNPRPAYTNNAPPVIPRSKASTVTATPAAKTQTVSQTPASSANAHSALLNKATSAMDLNAEKTLTAPQAVV